MVGKQSFIMKGPNNDKAYTSPQLFGQVFNFRIFIQFFILWSKETIKVVGIGAVFA